ncbi:hypothetical protein ACTID9_26365 [Brevibacillus fluminis]|uniref:hypothetical protein n=1 Tax=Brevibacillus fluminis TaxID=511487 RepID=UPI003F8B921E
MKEDDLLKQIDTCPATGRGFTGFCQTQQRNASSLCHKKNPFIHTGHREESGRQRTGDSD